MDLVRYTGIACTAALFASFAASSHAATVCDPYVNAGAGEIGLVGATVCFVYNPADIDPIYGTLNVSGDNIFVTPTNFKAQSNNTDGLVTVSGTGTIQVIAQPGYVLDGINVGELGDYNMTGSSTSVDVDGWLRVFDWSDPSPIFGTDETTNLTITGDLTIQDGNNHNWSGSGVFDLTTPLWDGRDHVGLTLQNTLKATSTISGDGALIQKKAIGSEITVSVDTSVIPVPAALWLFGSGLIGLVAVARRKQTQ